MAQTSSPTRADGAEPRRSLFSGSFIFMMVFAFACVVGGYLFAVLGPQLFPVRARPAPTAIQPAAAMASAPSTVRRVLAPTGPQLGVYPVARDPLSMPAPLTPQGLIPRVEAIETRQAVVIEAAEAALAAANLGDASQRGGPFVSAFSQVAQAMPTSAHTRSLAPLAAIGAPSRAALSAEFADLAQPLEIAANAPGQGSGFADRVAYWFSSIITVRRSGADSQVRATPLIRVQRLVAAGDLEPALSAIATLPGAARDRLANWRIRAERRVLIDQHVQGLRTEALERLRALPPTAIAQPPMVVSPTVVTPPVATSNAPVDVPSSAAAQAPNP